jgi:hypothetical protein
LQLPRHNRKRKYYKINSISASRRPKYFTVLT